MKGNEFESQEHEKSDEIDDELGLIAISFLGLKVKKNGLVTTGLGQKSPRGLIRTLRRLCAEKEEKMRTECKD
jgi:hypothetical protein